MQLTFARIFGSIPGPVVFGAVIDNTCILWQSTEDGSGEVVVVVVVVVVGFWRCY